MRSDSLLNFLAPGSPLSCVGATGATFTSNVIDLLGNGVGLAPTSYIGNAALFGADMGVGHGFVIPTLDIAVGTAFVTGGSATLNVQFQAAPDTAGTHLPGSYTTLLETGAIAASALTAGKIIARYDWPPNFPANLNPRFLRLAFVTPSGQQFSAGTIAFAIVTAARDDYAAAFASSNYVVQ